MKRSVLIAALAISAIAPASSEAGAPGSKQCPVDSLCLWAKANYEGKKTVISAEGTTNLSSAFNNRTSSVKSRYSSEESDKVLLFDQKNATGSYFCLGVGLAKKQPHLGPPYNFNNKTTSVMLPAENDDAPVCL